MLKPKIHYFGGEYNRLLKIYCNNQQNICNTIAIFVLGFILIHKAKYYTYVFVNMAKIPYGKIPYLCFCQYG